MKQVLRRRPSPAMIVAVMALIASSAATATAAVVVTGKQIRNRSVTNVDLRRGSVTSGTIRDATIRSEDLRPGILRPLQSSARQASRASGPTGVAAGEFAPVAALDGLEPGAYVVFGKVDVAADVLTGSSCRLAAVGSGVDSSGRGLRANGTPETLNLQLVALFSTPGAIGLECRSSAGRWSASSAKITAIRIGDAQNVELPG